MKHKVTEIEAKFQEKFKLMDRVQQLKNVIEVVDLVKTLKAKLSEGPPEAVDRLEQFTVSITSGKNECLLGFSRAGFLVGTARHARARHVMCVPCRRAASARAALARTIVCITVMFHVSMQKTVRPQIGPVKKNSH